MPSNTGGNWNTLSDGAGDVGISSHAGPATDEAAKQAIFEDAALDAVEGTFKDATADAKVAAKGNAAEQTVFGATAVNAVKG